MDIASSVQAVLRSISQLADLKFRLQASKQCSSIASASISVSRLLP